MPVPVLVRLYPVRETLVFQVHIMIILTDTKLWA